MDWSFTIVDEYGLESVVFVRARSEDDAKAKVAELHPGRAVVGYHPMVTEG